MNHMEGERKTKDDFFPNSLMHAQWLRSRAICHQFPGFFYWFCLGATGILVSSLKLAILLAPVMLSGACVGSIVVTITRVCFFYMCWAKLPSWHILSAVWPISGLFGSRIGMLCLHRNSLVAQAHRAKCSATKFCSALQLLSNSALHHNQFPSFLPGALPPLLSRAQGRFGCQLAPDAQVILKCSLLKCSDA